MIFERWFLRQKRKRPRGAPKPAAPLASFWGLLPRQASPLPAASAAPLPAPRPPQLDLFLDYLPSRHTERRKNGSDPELLAIWTRLRREYFPERIDLDAYRVVWSRRHQTRSLAACTVESRIVRVAGAMQHPECTGVLEALLYHELCHAVLGPLPVVRGRRAVHGREFRALERRHPAIPALDAWIKQGGWRTAVRRAKQQARMKRP